MILHIPI